MTKHINNQVHIVSTASGLLCTSESKKFLQWLFSLIFLISFIKLATDVIWFLPNFHESVTCETTSSLSVLYCHATALWRFPIFVSISRFLRTILCLWINAIVTWVIDTVDRIIEMCFIYSVWNLDDGILGKSTRSCVPVVQYGIYTSRRKYLNCHTKWRIFISCLIDKQRPSIFIACLWVSFLNRLFHVLLKWWPSTRGF